MTETDERALAVVSPQSLLPDRQTTQSQLRAVVEFQATVRELFIKGHDFGVIPGTDKPTLLKPGAEKLAKLLHLADYYDIVEKVEDWERPLFRYLVRCRLQIMGTDTLVSSGMGECNSMEKKYRYRWVWPSDVSEEERKYLRGVRGATREVNTKHGKTMMYRLDNDDIFSQVNTILKMAKKRALVDAALSAGRLSDLFTQDIEDLVLEGTFAEVEEQPSAPAATAQPSEESSTPAATPAATPEGGADEGQLATIRGLRSQLGDSIDQPVPTSHKEAEKLIKELNERYRQRGKAVAS